jgi:DNA-binding transcriptional LysR family regulator
VPAGWGSGAIALRLCVTALPTTNIPTELLRTLITVVDLRSFTKAAHALGITQPAVSAQIKRLQFLLDVDVFDKSAPGVMLTDKGELVVSYARRMLSINDQILHVLAPGASVPPLRVGMPADFGASTIPKVLAEFHTHSPQLRFQLRGDASDTLLRDLRQDQLDLAIALSASAPAGEARQYWREELVWVKRPGTRVDPMGSVPVVTLREGGFMNRLTTLALNQADRDYEVVFTAFAAGALLTAVGAGLGVGLLPRSEISPEVEICQEPFLPSPPEVYCGVYLRERVDSEMLNGLADALARALMLRAQAFAPPMQRHDVNDSASNDTGQLA